MTMRILVIALALTAMGGCAQQWAEADDATCRSYGARPGTDGYARCRMFKDEQRRQAFAQMGRAMQEAAAASERAQAEAMANRPRQTTCNRFGSQINCTTW